MTPDERAAMLVGGEAKLDGQALDLFALYILRPGRVEHLAIPFLGLALIDNSDPERLAKACAEEGRNEFLFTATPLRLVGATGAPAHPLAIF